MFPKDVINVDSTLDGVSFNVLLVAVVGLTASAETTLRVMPLAAVLDMR